MEAALAMPMHSQAVKGERSHTRPRVGDDMADQRLGNVVELIRSSRQTEVDVEIAPPLLVTEALFLRLLDRLYLWLQRARQRRQLGTLSDRMLKDIGVSRADVEYETSQRFWQD